MEKYSKNIIFILLLVFLATFLIHKINLPTDDLGRHIKAGEIIWQTKAVPKINLFSYAEPNHPFINHHWLSELIFYWLYLLVGFSGLVVLKIIILLFTFGIIYYLAVRRANFWWATVFAFLSILVFVERTDVRPEIFSYLFLALYLLIFYLYNSGRKKYLWWLLPIQLLWTNMHIYFFLGPFLMLIFLIQQLINYRRLKWWSNLKSYLPGRHSLSPELKEIKSLIILSVFLFLALLINPNFIKGALYPLFVLQHYGYDIVENKSPFFLDGLMNDPAIFHFKILISLIIFGFILNHRRASFFDFITGAFAIFFSWFALRNFPVSAMLALPVLAVSYHQGLSKLFNWLKTKLADNLKYIRLGLSIIAAMFLLFISYANFNNQTIFAKNNKEKGIGVTKNSEASAKFYLNNNIKGPLFNNFDIGSYLDFYLYPKQQTFVDNRPEAFNVEFWQYVYIPAQSDWNWWQVFSAHYKFNSIFFGHTDGTGWGKTFLERIIKAPEWVTVYLDRHAIILVKNTEINQAIIKKYSISQEEVARRLNQYKLEKTTVVKNKKLEESREKGLDYINKNFGPGIATY